MANACGNHHAANLTAIMRFWVITEGVVLEQPIMPFAMETWTNRRGNLHYFRAMNRPELFGNHGWCSLRCLRKWICGLDVQFVGQKQTFRGSRAVAFASTGIRRRVQYSSDFL